MLELFLNAVRVAVSDDVRESVSSILELIRRLPEWEQSICTLEANIARSFAEQASLLRELTVSKLEKLGYSNEAIEAFKTTYSELVTNSFEHGCKSIKDKVKIVIDITAPYVALTVINPKKRTVNLDDSLKLSKSSLSNNPYLRRGRGLLIVQNLADSLEETASSDGVKAVVYQDRVSIEIDIIDDLTIVELIDGLDNPSMKRRIISLASEHLENNLILDFSRYGKRSRRRYGNRGRRRYRFSVVEDSFSSGLVLELDELFSKAGKQIVALVGRDNRLEIRGTSGFPNALVAYSLGEALQKVYRQNLIKKIKARVKRFRTSRQRSQDRQ